jgi:hypothetical protein
LYSDGIIPSVMSTGNQWLFYLLAERINKLSHTECIVTSQTIQILLNPVYSLSFIFHSIFHRQSSVIFFKWSQLGAHYSLLYLFQLLYMFRSTMCPSSGELAADQTATRTERKIPVSHSYSKFSWWWAHSWPKYVEKLK